AAKPVARAAKPAAGEPKPAAKPVARAAKPAAGEPKPAAKPAATTKPVARAATGADSPPRAAPSPVTDAIASPGQGRPLAPQTRESIERRMPVDLRGVRVHDDAAAQDAARSIDARAFTHGSDIWLGHGESDHDVGLMAHEATHVAQQSDSVARAPKKDAPAKKKVEGPLIDKWPEQPTAKGPGSIDPAAQTMRLSSLKVPDFKAKLTDATLVELKRRPPRADKQREDWEGSFGEGPDISYLKAKPRKMKDVAEPIYYLKPKNGTNTYVIGPEKTVLRRARRPSWDINGQPTSFDVDHRWEYQIGGPDREVSNLWLLQSEANQSSGRVIKDEVKASIAKLVNAAPDNLRNKPEAEEVRDSYKSISVEKLVPAKNYDGNPKKNYEKTDIETGKSLAALEDAGDEAARLSGSEQEISLFERKEGGKHRAVPINANGVGTLKHPEISKTVEILGVTYTSSAKFVKARLFANSKGVEKFPVDNIEIGPMEGVAFGGYVNPTAIHNALVQQLKVPPMSPITIDEIAFDWDQGIVAAGKLTPSVPLIDKLGLDLKIDGKGVYLSRVFSGGELAFPGPVKVTGSSLEVQFGTHGFALIGRVPFVIEGLGTGLIEASAASKGEAPVFELIGTLNLDSELFDEAMITVGYKNGKFSGAGKLVIGPKKLKGVKSATITAAIDEDRIEAAGDVVMDIPGVERGAVSLVYDKTTGLEIAGKLQLSNSIPALKSGTIGVKVNKAPEGAWKVSGEIEATAGIPGITATVTGRYEDGAFEVFGTAAYERGMLKGSVGIGATNRPVGDDGKPAGEPTNKLTAFGKGEVTVRLAKWLQGTVGMQVTPKGELIVSGKIGLPSTLDIFDEKKLSKRIFSIGIDIPIVGFSVLGQRVGIFATIGGGLDAEASIGPGQIRKAELGVTYNPDDEAATHVTGAAELYIPAHAGLRLFVKGGVGAGIPIVSAEVGLEVGAALGLDAAMQSNLQIDWTPGKGLVLDASLSTFVQPKFVFDLTAYANVTVDYLFGTSTLYDERWKLAQFEYGSNLRFGVKFPVHYEEGKAFDVALSDVEFEYPQIDAGDLLKGLVKSIV
ncbi:DUF4157 domain-containing protein, partial [Solirubrobacter ginsenosidimutans]